MDSENELEEDTPDRLANWKAIAEDSESHEDSVFDGILAVIQGTSSLPQPQSDR